MELFSIRIQRTFQLVSTFKNQFEIDENKYHGIVERNRSNGSKGGAPKRAKNDNSDDIGTTQINPNNPVGFFRTQKSR